MSRRIQLIVVVVMLLLGGYAPIGQAVEPEDAIVRTFFATDRNTTGQTKPDEIFGKDRSRLSYGTADVRIPGGRGELESQITLLRTDVRSKDEFFKGLAARTIGSPRHRALLFIHGYNVTFEDAARRTAQMSYDLGFEGAPVFYSWPSQGSTPAYTVDEQNIEWAQTNINNFLEDFLTRSNAKNIYLIAHGIGNRALIRALASLLEDKPTLRDRLTEVILVAPDVDAEVFKADIAPVLTALGLPITLYASSDDLGLSAANRIHGYPRAGDSGRGVVVVPGVETIDASAADTSLVKHSYFSDTPSILSDMSNLFRSGQRADKRPGLRSTNSVAGLHWILGEGKVSEPEYAVVRTFFATDRNLTGKTTPKEMFGSDRASLTYGTCDVSIPRDHLMGELESPSIWRLEFREKPTKHVVLLAVAITTKDRFFKDVADRVHQSSKSNALLFVHGYNVTFEDAARRTAQMSYDLGFEGAPVFYSWPSQGSTPAYTVDEQNIEWTQTNLKNFLQDFFERSDAKNVYLIAHSMGNRALTRAVSSLLAEKPTLQSRLKEVILTAPDIDASVFKRDIAPALTATRRPVTLYASSEDLALKASKKVHGYPRAGDAGQGLVVLPGVETIDATRVDTSFVGHSYFAESRSVLSDIFYLIRHGQRADQRFGLRRIDEQSGRHWEFKQ